MKWFLLLITTFNSIHSFSQGIASLDQKWCFTGARTTILKYDHNHLYIGLLESMDTLNFGRFLKGLQLDSSIFSRANVTRSDDTVFIEADFPKIQHSLRLKYDINDTQHLVYKGDVYFDSTSIIHTNRNCRPQTPECINKLYSKDDIRLLITMKGPDKFSRDDAFKFLLRLSLELKDKCNRCYAGFTDAWMNEVLIDMGFNPITTHSYSGYTMYNTSGFTFFMKTRFEKDAFIKEMSEYLIDEYIHHP